jgi:DNA-binding response OmpR family regulator
MHILLAEDDVKLTRVMRRVLTEEGYVVDAAADGPTALAMAATEGIDLVVLDVMLPGMDGFRVCRALREGGVHTPVLMLTAKGTVDDRVEGLDAGADDYLVKPFAVTELLARMRALTRRSKNNVQGPLSAGDLTLDVARHCATRGGKEIPLTVKEFQLLEYLLRHPNQVLSRTQILDAVWQYDRAFTSNVVDTYVHYLRSKVDKGFDKRLIRTVRGAGYMLKV